MCEKKAAIETDLVKDIVFEESVCSPEFAEGCKEPSEK